MLKRIAIHGSAIGAKVERIAEFPRQNFIKELLTPVCSAHRPAAFRTPLRHWHFRFQHFAHSSRLLDCDSRNAIAKHCKINITDSKSFLMNIFATAQLLQFNNPGFLLFPLGLLVYYFICWLLVGRDPKIGSVSPQYEPPQGVSPGVARYVTTGGSDGTTLAAILADVAAKQVISIQPEGAAYRIKLLNKAASLLPEEAALIKSLMGTECPIQPYFPAGMKRADAPASAAESLPQFVAQHPMLGRLAQRVIAAKTRREESLTPASAKADGAGLSQPALQQKQLETELVTAAGASPASAEVVLEPRSAEITAALAAIQAAFHSNLQDVYFRWNFRFVGLGILATFVWAMATALTLTTREGPPLFVTFWLLFFTSISGLVITGAWTARPTHPTPAQRMQVVILPLLFFVLPGLMIYTFALPSAHSFVLALLMCVALNNIFFVLMRAPTVEGRRVLEQLAGFREFLVRVEQDRLQRLNTPAQKAELMNRFLGYAIALNVREGWGDTMAAAFSNSIVER
jgi:hypothetical protein